MCFNAAVSGPIVADGARRRRRPPIVLIALGLVVLAAVVAAVALGAVRSVNQDTPSAAAPAPRFVEEAAAAGLDHVYDGEFSYFVGGGVAAFDCDGDGKPELYLAGGIRPAALFKNESPIGGALRFERLSDPTTDLDAVTGAYPLDIDGDGITDLAVLRHGENVLLRGLGDCRFERANETWGFDGGTEWTTAFAATWEAGSTWPTVAIGNYHDEDFTNPDELCQPNQLVRPAVGGSGFGPPTTLASSWCALSMLFSDWDHVGQRDLRVSNDHHYYSDLSDGEEQLWKMTPGEPPRLYTRDEGWQLLRIWGMGIASQDIDGDGRPEVFLTNQADNMLQTLVAGAQGPDYTDISRKSGTTATHPYAGGDTRNSTAWHAEFQDVNNDGLMDLFVTKGNVEAMEEFAAKDPPDLLIGQPDRTFVEGAQDAGIVDFARGRGAAVVDFNLDGLLDIVEVARRENVRLWRGVGAGTAHAPAPMGHWAALRLQQPGPNRDAIGAWISVKIGERVIDRELTVGGGHEGGQLGWTHFGLGPSQTAEVQVQWPDGEVGPWQSLPADGFAVIERGADAVRPWTPGAD